MPSSARITARRMMNLDLLNNMASEGARIPISNCMRMSDREQVFSSIQSALASGRQPAAGYPSWENALVESNAIKAASGAEALFCQKLEAVGGRLARGFGALDPLIAELANGKLGYCDPGLNSLIEQSGALSGLTIETEFDRSRVDEYAFGITRASAGIAESGSLVLTGGWTSSRLGALAPWVHIGVLERSRIVRTIADAIALFGDEPNAVFVTGPSKTADVEGILIKGVHGPGAQICCLV